MMRDYSKFRRIAVMLACFLALSASFFAGRLSASGDFVVKTQKGVVSAPSAVESGGLDSYFREDTASLETTAAISGESGAALVNINSATEKELDTLPGVGPVIAGRIIEYRTKYGDFQSIEELAAVQGIGEKTVKKLEPLICI